MRELDYFQTDGTQTHIYFLSKDFPNHLAISSLLERGRTERRGLILSPLAERVHLSPTEKACFRLHSSVIRLLDGAVPKVFNLLSCFQDNLLSHHLSKVLMTIQ